MYKLGRLYQLFCVSVAKLHTDSIELSNFENLRCHMTVRIAGNQAARFQRVSNKCYYSSLLNCKIPIGLWLVLLKSALESEA
uniref:Uncharacterized protein n=1 Tax=Arundo donax TaxID=35708 RepID=A0A0A9G073_ARUDO